MSSHAPPRASHPAARRAPDGAVSARARGEASAEDTTDLDHKALELTAEAASTLDGCQLVTYSNGSSTGASIALAGTVAAGSVYTLCSALLAELLGPVCDRATNLSFNGDDAVALACDGVMLDVIGQIGVDPGTAWTGPSGSTLNATLRRRCDRFAPDPDGTDPFEPDLTFTPLAVDTFDGLGSPMCG